MGSGGIGKDSEERVARAVSRSTSKDKSSNEQKGDGRIGLGKRPRMGRRWKVDSGGGEGSSEVEKWWQTMEAL